MSITAPEAPVQPPGTIPPLYIAVADWWQDLKADEPQRYADDLLWFELGERVHQVLTGSQP